MHLTAILVGTPPAPQFVLNNVGKLRTKGVEVAFSAKPSNWLRLDAGASYTDAIMTSFPAAQGFNGQTGALFNEHYASSLADNFGIVGGSAANDTHVITQFLSRDSERNFGMKISLNF